MRAVLKVRAVILSAARSWLDSHDYLEVQVPTLTSAAVEGGATLFEVKYFDEKAYLTQSWQLYAEALIAAVGKIYTIAPSFRAEKSRTRRHLTEYWHLEAEAPYVDLNGIMEVEEQMLSHLVGQLLERTSTQLALFERKREDLEKVKPPFPRITYDDAFKMIGGERAGLQGAGRRVGRVVSWACKLEQIRDAGAFPGLSNRLYAEDAAKGGGAGVWQGRVPKGGKDFFCFELPPGGGGGREIVSRKR